MSERLADIMRQGFMKQRAPKKRAMEPERPIVACEDCLNWHRQGKHTADAATRKANRAERRAKKEQES